jgi:hypothetical protein
MSFSRITKSMQWTLVQIAIGRVLQSPAVHVKLLEGFV